MACQSVGNAFSSIYLFYQRQNHNLNSTLCREWLFLVHLSALRCAGISSVHEALIGPPS